MAKSRWITLPSALDRKTASFLDPKIVDDGRFLDAAAALAAAPSARTVPGTPKADRLIGTSGNDVLSGLGGNDTLDGRKGRDRMTGGTGNDTYIVDNSRDQVIERARGGTDLVKASVHWILGSQVENLTLTGRVALKGTGNALANTITGNDGHNILDGKAGADRLAGAKGNDTYIVDHAGDRVTEKANQGLDTVQASVSYTLGAHVENLLLTGSALFGTGNELANAITGNALANQLNGDAGNDTLDGGAGDDVLLGGTGTDLLLGGDGNDALDGGSENDSLEGGLGNDRLDGEAAADAMAGGQGDDVYFVDHAGDVVSEGAGSGTDTVWSSVDYALGADVERLMLTGAALSGTGNALANTITGTARNNILDGGAGADTLDGGTGDDTYVVDEAGDVIVEAVGGGTDTVRAAFDYTLGNTLEHLVLIGTAVAGTGNGLDNAITGNALDNTLDGGDGADTLDGGGGADTLIGGAGNDVYIVDHADDVIDEQGGETDFDTVRTTLQTYFMRAGIETLVMLDDNGTNANGNTLNNNITTGSGDDFLDGGTGADTLRGGSGNDTYTIDQAGDTVVENADEGIDTVRSPMMSYTLGDHVENLTLIGGAMIGIGNDLDNFITGNSFSNQLEGRDGNDTLVGGGTDALIGGTGDDLYIVKTDDWVIEATSEGTDTVEAAVSFVLSENVEILVLTGTDNINGTGNGADNRIVGNSGNNILDGGGGTDTLEGGEGNDIYVIDSPNDTIIDTSGTSTVRAAYEFGTCTRLDNPLFTAFTINSGALLTFNPERLELAGNVVLGIGTAGSQHILGNNQRNVLFGNGGLDTLNGGEGNDVLFASTGPARTKTVFEFSGKLGHDTLRGFNVFAGDIIDLRPFNKVSGSAGNYSVQVITNPENTNHKYYRVNVFANSPTETWTGSIDVPDMTTNIITEAQLRANILLF
ncbi:calcium-binding protein [Microvirga sp. VF16]|uniref:calcium-binding protein n=1 Tax=Microvirga sp. VF16 TaxID=2807101 RepID=UPI00193D6391|nr:calcium-binding protein [Microvirga sp. VF16]QRM29994.1 calcium-binding protein [Microvirga sp. VF16]